jgi:hypothetical protein
MSDMRAFFERQAAWQAGRRDLSWPDKVRMAEAVRDSVEQFRKLREIHAKSHGGEECAKPDSPPDLERE